MLRRYLCILNWSRFFIIFILMFLANIMLGVLLPQYYENGGAGFGIVFLYVMIIMNSVLWYDNFFTSDIGLKVLEITPVKINDVVRLYKYSKYITLFTTSLIGSILLLINDNKMGFVIIPNTIIFFLINYYLNRCVERNQLNDEEAFSLAICFSEIVMMVIYGIEFLFLLVVF